MFGYFVKYWKRVGFSLPSSSFLVRRMFSHIQKDNLKHIVELGAGEGSLTRELVRAFPKGVRIDAFEIDPSACKIFKKEFASYDFLVLHEKSATVIGEMFTPGSVDLILSTLPLGSLEQDVVDEILRAAHRVLKPGGQFLQYQYWMVNKKDVEKYFHMEKLLFEPRNFGPAWIYVCRKG